MRQLHKAKRVGWLVMTLALTLVISGCQTNSFLDQSQVYRGSSTAIMQPILSSISLIEDDQLLALATDHVRPGDLMVENREYIIGPGDTLRISIYELRIPGVDDIQDRRVTETGEIRLAIVGPIVAAGVSPSQLERQIADQLDENNILRDATVSVTLLDSRQNTYVLSSQSTQGGTTSGTYVIPKPDFRLMEALSVARGVPDRTRRIYIIRQAALDASVTGDYPNRNEVDGGDEPPAPEDPADLIEGLEQGLDNGDDRPEPPTGVEQSLEGPGTGGQWVNIDGRWVRVESSEETGVTEDGEDVRLAGLSELVTQRIIEIDYQRLREGDMRYNVVIRPGDIIRVPAANAGFVYIEGQINRPGAYTIPGEQELTLRRLVASAGGLGGLAWPERVDLVRQISDGEQAIVRLNLRAIAQGTEPDIYLKSNDMIYIGTSGVAVPLAVFRNGLRMTYGFGFVLDRNFEDDVFSD